jgi:hypothetical protein
MLVLLESNKNVSLSHLFSEISVVKVGISYYNEILKKQHSNQLYREIKFDKVNFFGFPIVKSIIKK